MSQAPTIWSSDLERIEVRGIPYLAYAERERSLMRFLEISRRWGPRVHVVQGDVRMTLHDLYEAVEVAAAALLRAGVQKGDRVLFVGWNSPSWVVGFWAVLRLGGVVVTGNAWWSDEELQHSVSIVDPVLVLTDRPERIGDGGACVTFEELAAGSAEPAPPVEADEDDEALVMFTSGTTGMPKAAAFSHRAMIAGQHSLLQITNRLPHQVADDHPAEITLQTAPFFHMGGVNAILRAALLGGTIVLTEGRFDPARVLDLIERERVQRWPAVPTMVSRVLALPEADSRDLSSVRSITLGGAPVYPELMDRVRELFPGVRRRLATGWGLTEAGGQLTAASGRDTLDYPGSVGRPLPLVELRIVDPDSGGSGEILVRSAMQMIGYVGDEDASVIDAAGWLHTGDLGRLDDGGRLWLTGRSKDVIVRGGENIAAARVEQVLLLHESVLDVAVVGLPHPDLGEEVAAAVFIRDSVTADALAKHAARYLARFEVPSRWWLRTEPLPTTDVGKVAKADIRERWFSDGPG